jgi:hypothetical protein
MDYHNQVVSFCELVSPFFSADLFVLIQFLIQSKKYVSYCIVFCDNQKGWYGGKRRQISKYALPLRDFYAHHLRSLDSLNCIVMHDFCAC